MFKGLLALLCLLCMLFACRKQPEFPKEPVIIFRSFVQQKDLSGKDSSGVLTIGFTDGDGDIGLQPGDTLPPFHFGGNYYYNLRIHYFEKQNGQWVEISTNPSGVPIIYHARVPYVVQGNEPRPLEGEIAVSLFTSNPFSTYDTIKFSTFLYDRALNASNTVETPPIVLQK